MAPDIFHNMHYPAFLASLFRAFAAISKGLGARLSRARKGFVTRSRRWCAGMADNVAISYGPVDSIRALVTTVTDEHHLKALADFHQKVADAARRRLAEIAERRARVHAPKPADLVKQYLAAGLSLDAAVDAVARQSPLSRDEIRFTLRLAERQKKREARSARNVEVMRLAGRGWTNRQISDRMGLDHKHVSRIVRRELGRAGQMPPMMRPVPGSTSGTPKTPCEPYGVPATVAGRTA